MFINDRFGLFAMTLGTSLIATGHERATRRFKNIQPVRIMALHAVYFPFRDGMMLGEMKLGLDLQMAFKAGTWFFAWIYYESIQATSPSHGDVFAAWTVARFTSGLRRP